jgi:hypothetical protein
MRLTLCSAWTAANRPDIVRVRLLQLWWQK